jgi:hypothetical protein
MCRRSVSESVPYEFLVNANCYRDWLDMSLHRVVRPIGLLINLQRVSTIRMTQHLTRRIHIDSLLSEHRSEAVAERMPIDPLP